MIPAMALLASCGGDATVDNTALDAKVNALLDKTKSDLKTIDVDYEEVVVK